MNAPLNYLNIPNYNPKFWTQNEYFHGLIIHPLCVGMIIKCIIFLLQRVQTVQGSWFVCCRSWRAPRWRASRSTCGRNGRSPSCPAVHTTSRPSRTRTWQCPWRIIACQPNGRHLSPNRRRYRRNTTGPCQNCSTKQPITRRPQSNGTATAWSTGTWEPITRTWNRRSFSDVAASPYSRSEIRYHIRPPVPVLLFFPHSSL